ncbi:Uncharacterized protein Rs2_36968 [Raphanus sativus]|uniref:Uncharacterized protein LOC108823092 n=1 Tax=Raphanus sativus TaxID=3726 RepID=A0A6J0KWG3_RAPSA|nr:uncharacterized protein LOC108823100 [Raphanus sativus]XP_056857141.1 uncharacterized protein LOC130506499 [Raphanus sativus]XP_056857455.1 uncharacterized protein LOC108823092 [Raphanus sativus]KAJ4866534.1 Uncharacterized protein Rs2_51939 [Raphanus sativus]KAJ4866844.1 Uncharacterized protein Rs2_51623 [Raphanus sativus]KAJ4879914.1 Uncharacterized protein Rs2_36968 [Raphanus sativus]
MSCKGEVVLRAEEVLFLLPSTLFNEIFLDYTGPFPQSYRGCSYHDRKPRMWHALNHYGSIKKPSSDDASKGRVKPRGTGVFLPAKPMSIISEEKRPKKKTCPIISSHSRQVFLPKEWAY